MNVKFNYNPDTRLSVILLLTTVTIFLWYKFARFPLADDRLNTLSDYLSPRQSSSSKRWIFSKCICVVPKCTKVGLFASSYCQLNLTNVFSILFCLYLKDRFVRLNIFVLFSLIESLFVARSRVAIVNYFFTRGQRIRSSRMRELSKQKS